jgi:hypothetical protein
MVEVPHGTLFRSTMSSQQRGTGSNWFPVRFSAFRRRSAARMIVPQEFEACSVTYCRYLPREIAVCRAEEK